MKYYREKIRIFKGTVTKGWTGHFWLEGEPEFLQFAMAAGLGSRNSGGFGFIEKVGENSRGICFFHSAKAKSFILVISHVNG